VGPVPIAGSLPARVRIGPEALWLVEDQAQIGNFLVYCFGFGVR